MESLQGAIKVSKEQGARSSVGSPADLDLYGFAVCDFIDKR